MDRRLSRKRAKEVTEEPDRRTAQPEGKTLAAPSTAQGDVVLSQQGEAAKAHSQVTPSTVKRQASTTEAHIASEKCLRVNPLPGPFHSKGGAVDGGEGQQGRVAASEPQHQGSRRCLQSFHPGVATSLPAVLQVQRT